MNNLTRSISRYAGVVLAVLLLISLSTIANAANHVNDIVDDGGNPVWADNSPATYNAGDRITGTNNATYDVEIQFKDKLDAAIGSAIPVADAANFDEAIPEGTLYACVNKTGEVVVDCTILRQLGAVPSLTEWGMIALVVLMLAAGVLIIRRRRAMART